MEAGVDYLAAETLLSLDEAMVICDAATEVCDLPLTISFSCEGDGRLYFGGSVVDAAVTLQELGVDAVGVNCSVGPNQLMAIVMNLKENLSIPVLVKPNAGIPQIDEHGQAHYNMDEEEFARCMKELKNAGASVLGGCCGTTPDYIKAVKSKVDGFNVQPITDKNITCVSSYSHCVSFGDKPVLIGERINPTGKKKFKEALKNNDEHIKDTLIYNMMRIIDTESITIANQMLKKRVSKIYKFGQIIGDGCPSCIPRTKKIVPVEELDWPPYHPNCCCIAVLYTEEEIMEAD